MQPQTHLLRRDEWHGARRNGAIGAGLTLLLVLVVRSLRGVLGILPWLCVRRVGLLHTVGRRLIHRARLQNRPAALRPPIRPASRALTGQASRSRQLLPRSCSARLPIRLDNPAFSKLAGCQVCQQLGGRRQAQCVITVKTQRGGAGLPGGGGGGGRGAGPAGPGAGGAGGAGGAAEGRSGGGEPGARGEGGGLGERSPLPPAPVSAPPSTHPQGLLPSPILHLLSLTIKLLEQM